MVHLDVKSWMDFTQHKDTKQDNEHKQEYQSYVTYFSLGSVPQYGIDYLLKN